MKPLFPLALLSSFILMACQPQQQTQPAAPASQPTSSASSAPSVAATSEATPVAASEPVATKIGQFYGVDMSKEDIGGDFTLTDGDGKPFTLSSLKGKVVLLTFGYTHCPDVCPTSLLTYADVLANLGDDAKNVAVVFVSVDPERDTPELIGTYAKQFHPDFIGVTATGDQSIPEVKQLYRVVSAKAKETSDKIYLVDHTSGTYIIDKNGEPALFEKYSLTAPQIAEDVKTLLKL